MTTKICPISVSNEDLDKISKFTRRPLSVGEVYTFSLILCDNEIDRDLERFTIPALESIATLSVREICVVVDELSGVSQSSRIFNAEIVTDPERKTIAGEPYTFLKAKVYMLKNKQTAPLIAKIDGEIKKEVSIECSVGRVACSVCGAAPGECAHQKGVSYGGVVCHHILDSINVLYGWELFVVSQSAVSQPKIKKIDESPDRVETDENFRVNTIQDAIDWFEYALKDGKCSPDCIECNAYEFALNALREKAKKRM